MDIVNSDVKLLSLITRENSEEEEEKEKEKRTICTKNRICRSNVTFTTYYYWIIFQIIEYLRMRYIY